MEKKLTKILASRTCFADGVLIESGLTYSIPVDISESAAKALVVLGKALPALEKKAKGSVK